MGFFIDWLRSNNKTRFGIPLKSARTYRAVGLPTPHPAEADTFDRQSRVPGHIQRALAEATVDIVGAGGLNGLVTLALARCGVRSIRIMDPDTVDRTNMPRQMFFASDLGRNKALCLAENVAPHAIAGGQITGIALRAERVFEEYGTSASVLIVGVDNNACRAYCSRLARARHVPAIFTMLSRDGVRCQCFLQGAADTDACLWCALPNLDPGAASPCAAASITSCLLAASLTTFFVHRALMGWPTTVDPFNWREVDLLNMVPHSAGMVRRRPDCVMCGGSAA